MSSTSDQMTQQNKKTRLIIGEIGVDTDTGIIGKGHSYDNGKTFTVDDTIYGRIYHADDHGKIWNGIQEKVKTVVEPAKSAADSAVAYANDAVEKSRVNSQAIDDINSAVSDAVSDAAVARSDGLRAWNAAQSNVNLIDLNYASASASISSARTEAIAAADEAKSSASVAQAGVVAVKSDVAAVKADVTATRSEVAVAKSDIADTKATLAQTASGLNSKITGVETSLADTANALSDAKTAFNSDVAEAKNLANAAQTTADSAIKSASSVANDLTAVAIQAKANADGITKVTSDVGLLKTTVADNSGNISTIQETAKQIQQSVSDNAGNITVAKQTADSAVAVASDAKSNAMVAIQTASQASITASNASGQAASAVITANGAMTTASDAKSNATVAVQTASGASLTAINAQSDATVAKQTASEAKVQASNAESDFAQLSIRANKIEANVANNSGAIASVQQTANGLTTTVADIKANGGGRNLLCNSIGKFQPNVSRIDNYIMYAPTIDPIVSAVYMTQGQQYTVHADASDGLVWSATHNTSVENNNVVLWLTDITSVSQIISDTNTGTGTTFTWNHPSGTYYLRVNTYKSDNSGYAEKVMLEEGIVAHTWSPAPEDLQNQFTQIKQSIDGVTTTINDPKTGLNATYQTAAGNATTISNIQGDVSQLKVSASSASVALSDAAGNISNLQATAKSFSAALSDTNSNVASVTATAQDLETKYADAAGDISQIKTDAKGMTQTISDAQGDIAKLKTRADGFDTQFANINGDINKIQTNATGVTQTLTNAKSDIVVLQSRADGFDAKYATAAGDINTLKANASGFSQTLTNAQGDISTLKSTVSGVQTTLTDAQGNISTLQSDVSGLKKTTSDNAGNIATLQANANTLTSQMSGAQGDISTLKQTASDFSSKVSGMETSLSDANSKINSITSNGGGRNLLSNSSGEFQPNSSKTDNLSVYSNSTVYMTQGQQYTVHANASYGLVWSGTHNPNVTSNNAVLWLTDNTKISQIISDANTGTGTTLTWNNPSGTYYLRVNTYNPDNSGYVEKVMLEKGTVAHDWSPAPEDIDAKITTNSTAIEQNKQAIALKADQTTVDKTNGTVQQLQSQLQVQAGQIATKVSSSDLDAKGYATQTYTQTQIKQTSDNLNANFTKLQNDTKTALTNLAIGVEGVQAQVYNSDGTSKITQLSNLIATKVSSDDFNSLSKSVNLQTLDSADINNMLTNGHYFVHNLANNPIGGWVYVDVTGNGNDRIRQDVYQDTDNQHCYRRLNGSEWTDWSKSATESQITQLSDDINLRVKSADLISQINLQAGTALIQSNKLVLDAGTTVFTGDAFIPDAYISALNADKLMFYGSDGTSATIGASVAQYDDDKTKSTINLQYSGGIEIHSSDQQGSILTMHDNTIRLASKTWGDNSNPYQYSGFYAAPNYSLMNTYHKDGTTSGVAIDDNRIWIYGDSKDQQLGALQADVGWYSINGKTGLLTGDQISLKAGNTQAVLTDNNININNASDTNDKNYDVAIHIKGWAEMTGWFTCMGLTQTSLLSTKTRIEPLDTAKALELINSADVATYQYKQEVAHGGTKRHASVIIDDVNDVARYHTPDEIISEDRQGRNDGDIVGYLMGAVQELTKKLKTLESKVG